MRYQNGFQNNPDISGHSPIDFVLRVHSANSLVFFFLMQSYPKMYNTYRSKLFVYARHWISIDMLRERAVRRTQTDVVPYIRRMY